MDDLTQYCAVMALAMNRHIQEVWQYWIQYHLVILTKIRVFSFVPIFYIVERIFPARPITLLPKGWLSDLFHTYEPWMRAAVVYWLTAKLSPLMPEIYLKGIAASLPDWSGFLLALMVAEIGFYFIHRATHTFSWLWEFHRVHHSSVEYYSLMTNRFHVFDLALFEAPNIILFSWLSIPADALLYYGFFRAFMDRYGHSNINGPFFTGYFIVSPHFHAWHHSTEHEAINKNFGRDTVFMDYIFGTAYYPKGKRATIFGDSTFSNNYVVQQIAPFWALWVRIREPARLIAGRKSANSVDG